ncbi:MAG: MiaB/RimO family radical SAM methylthiotransferase [Candidatus Berkelbacteria bacterium]|nr:MiaB/RimO family radical SAM methylthiotransferase [Candidatus Berkelbacteria bacterium]
MKNFYIWTIGCQYNVHDGTVLNYILKKLGFNETDPAEADFIIILACSVRQTAIDRVFGRIKHWRDKKIILTACVLPQDRKKFAKLNIKFWDIKDTAGLAKILDVKVKNKIDQFKKEGAKFSNYVPIMVGCNNFCSYCAVPFTRGREFSIPFNTVLNNVKNLVKKGEKEIMLLGQNVNSYKYGFAKLLEKLNALPGNFKVSFTSNHPKDMTDDIIEAVATLPKIKKEIHLPLQSGSDKILRLMNRPYTAKKYLKIIDKIHKASPKIKITTDAIVGFPTETKKDFQKTIDVFKKVRFSQAYIGKYSPRPGTAAAKMKDGISWQEKQRRWHILNKLINIDK